MQVKAFANTSAKTPFGPYSFERRKVGPKDVSIKIEFCGVCHSDIHTARSEWGPTPYPCVPGHEIIGKVVAIGNDVNGFKVDQRVGVGCMVDSCRTCESCDKGLEQYCENGFVGTYGSNLNDGEYTKGGYSDHIVVDQRFVLNVPENLDPAAVAPLLCAGITTYSPLKYVGAKSDDHVAILGLGGLGHMGVKLAKSFGCKVSVLSRSPQKKEDAIRLGADNFILTTNKNDVEANLNAFDYILDTVSAPHDLDQAFTMLKPEGTLIMVGASDKPISFHTFSMVFKRKKMIGSLIGGIPETQEMLDHCGKHGITSDIEMIEPQQINEAYERILKSDVKYRFVIDCAKL